MYVTYNHRTTVNISFGSNTLLRDSKRLLRLACTYDKHHIILLTNSVFVVIYQNLQKRKDLILLFFES